MLVGGWFVAGVCLPQNQPCLLRAGRPARKSSPFVFRLPLPVLEPLFFCALCFAICFVRTYPPLAPLVCRTALPRMLVYHTTRHSISAAHQVVRPVLQQVAAAACREWARQNLARGVACRRAKSAEMCMGAAPRANCPSSSGLQFVDRPAACGGPTDDQCRPSHQHAQFEAPAMGSHATSLALALSGFTVEAASEGSEAPMARPHTAGAAAADRPVATGAAALVAHASQIAARVLERWQAPGYSPEQDGEQLASLCFALQSTVGQLGRLSEADERSLFQLASALWGASLQALSMPGGGTGDMFTALERLGNELFALVDGDSDNTQDCARCEEGKREAAGGCCSPALASRSPHATLIPCLGLQMWRSSAGWPAAGRRQASRIAPSGA